MKKVKYAKPAMQHIMTLVGGPDNLKNISVKAYSYTRYAQQTENMEENKESTELSEAE